MNLGALGDLACGPPVGRVLRGPPAGTRPLRAQEGRRGAAPSEAHGLPCPAVWAEGENDHRKQNFWQFLKVLFKSSRYICVCVSMRTGEKTPQGGRGASRFLPVEVRCAHWQAGRDGAGPPEPRRPEAGSEVRKRGRSEEQDWGRSEPACHLRASPNKPSEVGLVLEPRLGR